MSTPNGEFTGFEIEKQDTVDNAIFSFLEQWGVSKWDMEHIGKIREALQEVVVDDLHLMTEQEFYPYRESETNGNIILEPSEPEQGEEMIVTDEQLVTAVKKVIEDMDADELAMFAGDALGGLCWYLNDNTYSFIPDINYYGALDFIKKLNQN